MYRNVVSSRELLSDSFSSEHQNSQLAYSQPEFSQISSQDMFTQQLSMNASVDHPGMSNMPSRKTTLYDKWKTKSATPLTRPMSMDKLNTSVLSSRPTPNVHSQGRTELSLQQQIQINKTKAKERDERDFLQQVVTTVQDCTKEVKMTLNSMREKLECDGEKSEHTIQHTITSFLDDLCRHQENILEAVREKERNSSSYHVLETEVALKDAKIKSLEKNIDDLKKEAPEKIIRALQKKLHSPHQRFDDKLTELIETTRDNHDQYTQQIQDQKQQLEQQQKQYSDLKKAHQTQIKDSEKRLINEISNLRKELHKKESTSLQDILYQLKSAQEQQFEELEKHIAVLLEGEVRTSSTSHLSDPKLTKKDVQDILKKHWSGVEKMIEIQFKNHLKQQEQQFGDVVEKLSEKECRHDNLNSNLSLPQFEDRIGEYHEDLKKQVEALHNRHIQEVKQLRLEMSSKRKEDNLNSYQSALPQLAPVHERERYSREGDSTRNRLQGGESVNQEVQPPSTFGTMKRSDVFCRDKHESAIVSPLMANYKKLNTRAFFSKTAFSPVAKVLPLRKETEELPVSTLAQDTQPVHFEKYTEQVTSKKKTKRRKKRSKFARPKKTKSAPKATADELTENESQTSSSSKPTENLPSEPSKFQQLCNKQLNKARESTSGFTYSSNPKSTFEIEVSKLQQNSKPESCLAYSRNQIPKNTFGMSQRPSVYDFKDDEMASILPSNNRPFYGSKTQSYSYNVNKNEIMSINTSQTVTFPRSSEKSYSNESNLSPSQESSPSLSITEVVVKRRVKCDKRTPDMQGNSGGVQKMHGSSQFPDYDILSTPIMKTGVGNTRHNEPFWAYRQAIGKPSMSMVRRAGQKRRLCDIDSGNILQNLQNQSKKSMSIM